MARVVESEGLESFGELLRDHRRAAGLTQEELAERAGVSPRSISELERGGAHIPRRDTVGLLARALGLSPGERETFEELVERRRRARPRRVASEPPEPRFDVERRAPQYPRLLTSIVGREQELEELASLLPNVPLLTLVGAGGVGKTRLAQELVRQLDSRYADGSCLVELAGLTDPSLVPGAVASVVGLRDIHVHNMVNLLAEYLSPKQLLLVLDNCEHLIDGCAELVAQLLRSCPHLQVLATSREPLGIAGELTWRVFPLELPDTAQWSPDQITESAAVRLFVERARAISNTLTITPSNAAAVARICIGLDGIPLALELAAARTRVLTIEELAARLDSDAGILRATNRLGLPQHRTMRATIDWSHNLLSPSEQMLLRRLSVFAGGCTLDLAEQVCSGDGIEPADVLDLIGQLVDKSMVQVDACDGVARYRLLEPIRQYAAERLGEAGEDVIYGDRHAVAFLCLAPDSNAGVAGPDEISSLDRLEFEHDNIRASLRWTMGHGRAGEALVCSAALFRFWERRGHFQEGCAWLEEALACAPDAPGGDRGWALNALAFLYWRSGDYVRARPLAEEALVLTRESGQPLEIARSLLNLGMISYFCEEAEPAVARLEECVEFGRQAGFKGLLAVALAFLGRALLWAHGPDSERAAEVIDESLQLAQSIQSRYSTGHALMTRGDLIWRQGGIDRAVPLWRSALAVRSELADRRGIAGSLERLAWGLAASEQYVAAAWFFGASEEQHRVLGIGLRHDEARDHAQLVDVTRQQLGELFASAWSAGRSASLDEAVRQGLEVVAQPASLAWSTL